MRGKIPQKTPWYPVRPAGMTNACYNPGIHSSTYGRPRGHNRFPTDVRPKSHARTPLSDIPSCLPPFFHLLFGPAPCSPAKQKNCTRKMVQQISRTWQPFLHLFHTGKVLRAFNPYRHPTFSARRKPIFLNPPLALGKTGDSPRAAWEDGGAAGTKVISPPASLPGRPYKRILRGRESGNGCGSPLGCR